MIDRIDHIGIAVHSVDTAADFYEETLGLRLREILDIRERGVRAGMIVGAGVTLELIEPLGQDSSLGRFLEKKGEGLHHISFVVPDIDEAVADLKSKGMELVTPEPLQGAHGRRIVFLSPKHCHGVLIELCEESSG
jgi:methylmalonyl-CoA/ethylmalonyl-CoA epimerase